MTKALADDVAALTGWTIHEWSLLPTKLFTVELINFRRYWERRNFAKLICIRPVSVSLEGLRRLAGEEISISSVCLNQMGDFVRLEIEITGDGRAVILSEDVRSLLY